MASTAGVVLMALARSGGVSEAVTAGVILSGIYFGDRGAPTSSCASLVAALTETDLYGNVRRMFHTAALPYALCLIAYTVLLSSATPSSRSMNSRWRALSPRSFVISPWALVPALIMLILPLLRVPIRRAMAISAAAAFVITVTVQGGSVADALRIMVVGYHPTEGLLASVVSGGGLVSMLTPFLMIPLAALYTGILEGTGALTQAQSVLERSAERIGRFPTMILPSLLAAMVLCNQTIVVMMEHQLDGAVYAKDGAEHEELAMDIANSGVTIAGLIPWCIACAVPLSMLGVGVEALPYACLLYLIPLATSSPSAFSSPQNPKEARHRYDLSVGQKIHQKPRGRHLACRAAGLRDALRHRGHRPQPAALRAQAPCRHTLRLRRHHGGRLQQPLRCGRAHVVTLLGFQHCGPEAPDPEPSLRPRAGWSTSRALVGLHGDSADGRGAGQGVAVDKILHPAAGGVHAGWPVGILARLHPA